MTAMASEIGTARKVPRERGLPLLGQSLKLLSDGGHYLEDLHRRYKTAVSVDCFGTNVTFLMGPEANKMVMQNRDDLFESSVWEYYLSNFFHRGVMLLDGDEHRLHRRIMQTAFTKDALRGYYERMLPQIEKGMGSWQPSERFLVFDHLKSLTLDVGNEAFAGHAPGPAADRMNKSFLDTVQAATGLVRMGLPFTRWRKGLKGRKFLEDFFYKEIPEKRANPSNDLFSRLCEARSEEGELFSDEDVVNHMIFTLMAAHDTSTITVGNMVYQLAKHPEWQARLREQSLALGKAQPDFEDLATLTEIELVMKEALRMCAPLPYMPRRLAKDIEFEGYLVPAGSMVGVSPWVTHYMPEYWSNPHRFDPERFLPERAEDKQHPFLWVPFGGGAHKCIGMHFGEMEIKAIMHELLLNFRWSVDDSYVMQQNFTSLPIPKDHLPVKLERLQ